VEATVSGRPCRRPPLEHWDVTPARKTDANLVRSTFACVVLVELRTKTARLDADDGIESGVVVSRAVEHLDTDRILLELRDFPRQLWVDRIAKKPPKPDAPGKPRTPEDSIQLVSNR
jgi:hypothetical protein